jgi:zinc transporter, ZIP family
LDHRGLSCLLLWGLTRWRGQDFTPLGLAASIAFAIGVHNLGEGLAVGSAFATGAAALGGFLLLGFTLHNVTEGVGIIAPLLERRPQLSILAGLACLAASRRYSGFGSGPLPIPITGQHSPSGWARALFYR